MQLSRGSIKALTFGAVALTGAAGAQAQVLNKLGTYLTGLYDKGAAEIVAFDPATDRLFVVNGAAGPNNTYASKIDILSIANPAVPSFVGDIKFASGIQSVSVKNGVVAVAQEQKGTQGEHLPGTVSFFNAQGAFYSSVTVGALPDMLTFTPDGTRVLVANEGEPNGYGSGKIDPVGSISVISVPTIASQFGSVTNANVSTIGFNYNGAEAALNAAGIRIFGPGSTASQDLEPEYIAVSADSTKAYVSLQENNALAIINLQTNQIETIKSFGLKDHNAAGKGLDPSDTDGIDIGNWPVKGMYMPDTISTFVSGGKTYLVSANEGDAREYSGYTESVRLNNSAYVLDPTKFPNAATLKNNANLGKLNVSTASGDTDGDGDFDEIHAFGARSFSIWDDKGNLVWDSGDFIEQHVKSVAPGFFNVSNTNNTLDNRSDDKGPEPEAVTVGEVNGTLMAFVGLERQGGIMVFDLTNPNAPQFLQYLNNRDFTVATNLGGGVANSAAGDLGPEGLLFIPASDSPTGVALLVAANEISGTTTVYSVVPEPAAMGLVACGALGLMRRRRGV
jgi:DNA-binding beta-propeller fold protein YncE